MVGRCGKSYPLSYLKPTIAKVFRTGGDVKYGHEATNITSLLPGANIQTCCTTVLYSVTKVSVHSS